MLVNERLKFRGFQRSLFIQLIHPMSGFYEVLRNGCLQAERKFGEKWAEQVSCRTTFHLFAVKRGFLGYSSRNVE